MEGIIATVRAAEAKQSPAMILLFPWAMQYGANLLVNLAADACVSASVPVTLHMDHAQDPDIIRKAADTCKFDSIMVDVLSPEFSITSYPSRKLRSMAQNFWILKLCLQ
ncbi:MAG: hypothetical protein Q9198_006275 [Flavoplaca austrocitrina]